jgi:YVTN family beta-propeller protein
MKLKASHLVVVRGFALSLGLSLALTANTQLSNPNGIVFDTSGNLWVANSGANQVLELDPANGTILNTITQGLNAPTRLTFAFGDLYVTNLNSNNVTVYNPTTLALVQTISSSAISRPLGIAVDAYGDVYIADNSANNVIALNIGGGLVETLTQDNSGYQFIAPGVLVIHGRNIFAGFGRNVGENAVIAYNVGEFLTGDPKEVVVYNDNVNTGPTGVAFDGEGYVYISEYTSGTAVKYAATNGKKPVLVIDQGTGGCEGIAVDKSGNIYVSNSIFNNITVYNSSGTLINTLF